MRTKYPRTVHAPWSLGRTNDDKVHSSMEQFIGKTVVVSVKMDGENSTIAKSYTHARSVDSLHHPSRTWLKNFWYSVRDNIPTDWRVCGENLYAKHSIHYQDLPSYFLGFSIWNKENICLSWTETLEWFSLIGITPVKTLYIGEYDEKLIKSLWDTESEGYIIRNADSFHYDDFKDNVAKFVRANHVQTGDHWMNSEMVRNELV